MRILGIDPGIDTTGFGLIETDGTRHAALVYGAIKTSSRHPFPDRLQKIHCELTAVLGRGPLDAVAIEEVFHAANVQSALRLGHARAVALLAAAEHRLPVFEYTAMQVKSAVVGYGRAEKHQVQHMVRLLLALPEVPSPHDASDALAIAICHVHHATTKAHLSRATQQQ